MCQVTSITQSITAANQAVLPVAIQENKVVAPTSQVQSNSNGFRVLICSENVPPQVNGIARRIGMYADGLRRQGCVVGECNMP